MSKTTVDERTSASRRKAIAGIAAAVGGSKLGGCITEVGGTAHALTADGVDLAFSPNIADLRASSGGAAAHAFLAVVAGYHSPGDGGGGLFYWDDVVMSDTDEDYGTVILVNGTGDRKSWKRLTHGPVDVRWFGATGNSPSDNSDALEHAVRYAVVKALQEGIQLTLPPIELWLARSLVVPAEVGLRGAGSASVLAFDLGDEESGVVAASFGGGGAYICNNGRSRQVFRDFTVRNRNSSSFGNGILLVGTIHTLLDNLVLDGWRTGVRANISNSLTVNRCNFVLGPGGVSVDPFATPESEWAIGLAFVEGGGEPCSSTGATNNAFIRDCFFNGPNVCVFEGSSGVNHAYEGCEFKGHLPVWIAGGNTLTFSRCYTEGAGSGAMFRVDGPTSALDISRCYFTPSGTGAVMIDIRPNPGAYIDTFSFVGNTISNIGSGSVLGAEAGGVRGGFCVHSNYFGGSAAPGAALFAEDVVQVSGLATNMYSPSSTKNGRYFLGVNTAQPLCLVDVRADFAADEESFIRVRNGDVSKVYFDVGNGQISWNPWGGRARDRTLLSTAVVSANSATLLSIEIENEVAYRLEVESLVSQNQSGWRAASHCQVVLVGRSDLVSPPISVGTVALVDSVEMNIPNAAWADAVVPPTFSVRNASGAWYLDINVGPAPAAVYWVLRVRAVEVFTGA